MKDELQPDGSTGTGSLIVDVSLLFVSLHLSSLCLLSQDLDSVNSFCRQSLHTRHPYNLYFSVSPPSFLTF